MTARKNLKPYRPFGAFSHDEGLEQLPNESVIIPSPPGPKNKSEGDSFNAQKRNSTFQVDSAPRPHLQGVKEAAKGEISPSIPDPTETKPYFPPPRTDGPTPLTPVDETPIEQNFVVAKKNSVIPAVFSLVAIFIITVFGIYAYFEIQPKLRGISIVKGLESSTKSLSQSFNKVDEALSNLVGLISSSDSEPSPKSPTQPTSVLGQSTQENLPSPTEDEYTNALRALKEAALNGKSAVASAEKDLETFQSRIPVSYPDSVGDIVEEAQPLSSRSDGLLFEVKKVTDFYSTVSSIQIDLLPTIKSMLVLIVELSQSPSPALYSDKLSSLKQTVASLETQTRALNIFLPEGLEKVQDDNLAVFTLLGSYLKDLEDAIGTGSFKKFANATQKLGIDLEVITTRAKTLELSYWQETGLLKKTKTFSTDLDNFSSKLSTFKKNNKLPFFND